MRVCCALDSYFFVEERYFGYTFFHQCSEKESRTSMWSLSALVGLIGALAEYIDLPYLDDNLSMPIVSACGLFLVHEHLTPWAQ